MLLSTWLEISAAFVEAALAFSIPVFARESPALSFFNPSALVVFCKVDT